MAITKDKKYKNNYNNYKNTIENEKIYNYKENNTYMYKNKIKKNKIIK